MAQVVREVIGVGLVLGLGALPARAQSMALPAADPVGIARSGAQVAYGYSLEAAALNPALLASLKERTGFYLSAGSELSGTQQSLESNQGIVPKTYFSSDRHRFLGAFGLSVRLNPALTLGLKLDDPFLRHGRLTDDAPTRYFGDSIDLSARRLEGQAAWAINPNLSVGFGLGAARLSYASSSVMRLGVPSVDQSLPISPTNQVDGLVEQRVGQSGDKVVPSYSLGLRWALNPRWTLGFAHQSGLKGDLNMKAGLQGANLGTYTTDGYSRASDLGTAARAATLLGLSQGATAGSSTLELPSQTTLGVRHRFMPMMTWEADLRWTSASLRAPSFAMIQTPSGRVSAPAELPQGKSFFSLNASAEMDLGKFWTLRAGFSLAQRSVEGSSTEPLLGGAPSASFSCGAGYKLLGGELSLGYQYRQSQDQDTNRLNGFWTNAGFQNAGTRLRMEGMGHLVALGYKMTF